MGRVAHELGRHTGIEPHLRAPYIFLALPRDLSTGYFLPICLDLVIRTLGQVDTQNIGKTYQVKKNATYLILDRPELVLLEGEGLFLIATETARAARPPRR